MLDAYEQDGWGPSSHRKLKPTEELKKSSESLIHAKKEIKELLKQMDPASTELAQNEVKPRMHSCNLEVYLKCAPDQDRRA